MNEPVEPCPTCPEGWRPFDKEHCAECYEGKIERLREALEPFVKAFQRAEEKGYAYHNLTVGDAADRLFYQDFERAAAAISHS